MFNHSHIQSPRGLQPNESVTRVRDFQIFRISADFGFRQSECCQSLANLERLKRSVSDLKAHHTLADFLSGDLRSFIADKKSASVECFPTSHDKIGSCRGKLNMFDFQKSRRILSASVWWSPTICRRQIYAVTNGKGYFHHVIFIARIQHA